MEYKKLLVVGDYNSGKTCYVKRLRFGANGFEVRYIATMGVEVHPISQDVYLYKLWDTSGKACFGGLRSGYYVGGECCLVFFDLSKDRTQEELVDTIRIWVDRVREVCEDIPIVVVGNKMDLVQDLPDLSELDLPHCFISCLEEINVDQPLELITNLL